MIFKRLFAATFISLTIGGSAAIMSNSEPTSFAQQNESAVTTEHTVFRTLMAGLEAHETSVATASTYLVNVRYLHNSPELQQAYDTYAVRDKNIKVWAKMLEKPPKLTLEFWAANDTKVRRDEKPLVSEGGDYTLAAYNGEQLQVLFFGNNIVQTGDLDSWPIDSPARMLQLSPNANLPRLSAVIKSLHARFVNKEVIGGLETYKVESLPSASGTIEAWWIVPSRGYVVVRHESKSKDLRGNGPITSWRLVEVVDKLVNPEENLWIPAVKRSIKYVNAETKGIWESVVRISLLSVRVNKPLPAQLLTLPLPPGSKVGRPDIEGGTYVIEGDKAQFEATLRQAKAHGEQPDLETIDIRGLEANVHTGKPDDQDLLDIPVGGKIETVQVPASPPRLPVNTDAADTTKRGTQ